MAEQNINELLELLDISENLLRFNSLIEKDIKQHGGTIVYSYNNIIIATEIDDNLFAELKKNPFIEYIDDIPMKRYGEIDKTLIDQLDISKLSIVLSANTTTSGATIENGNPNQSGNTNIILGNAPIITNSSFSITALTNEWFEYDITSTGTQPISFNITPQIPGPINLYGNKIKGYSGIDGTFPIEIKATNSYGTDNKILIVNSISGPKITSPLITYGYQYSAFTYTITNTGLSYIYRAYNLPNSLTLSNNVISGTLLVEPGIYKAKIIIDCPDLVSTDSKDLEIRVTTSGSTNYKPVITSSGTTTGNLNEYFEYIITATGSQPVSFGVEGSLPKKLKFSTNKISGIANEPGIYTVILKASNYYGTSSKSLVIKINGTIV